jgi:hypothetical protein
MLDSRARRCPWLTDLVVDRVEPAAIDFDEDVVGGLEGWDGDVDELEDAGVAGGLEGDGLHRLRNRGHGRWSAMEVTEGDEMEVTEEVSWWKERRSSGLK